MIEKEKCIIDNRNQVSGRHQSKAKQTIWKLVTKFEIKFVFHTYKLNFR